jgi:hypothetical protein
MNRYTARVVSNVLMVTLWGTAEPILLCAQEPSPQVQQSSSPALEVPQPGTQSSPQSSSKDPTKLENRIELPDSPGTTQMQQAAPQSPNQVNPQNSMPTQPTGTAAAPAGKVSGNMASKPAGVAIAPPKQRQVHSFLIKMGIIAGAGIALGTVAALSMASSPKPPGAR